jgi:hypothetical protein
MITEIYSNKYFFGTGKGFIPYFTGVEVTGTLRSSNGYLEVYNGQSWVGIGSSGTITFTKETQSAIDWAIQAKQKEDALLTLVDKYPALKNAKEQFDTIRVLCECEDKLEQQQTP